MFPKFSENYLCWSLFLIKLQSWDLQLYYEETPEHLQATASQFTQELKTNVKKDAIISPLECQAPNETIFYAYLREYLQTDEGQFYQNSIVFDDRTGKIKVILVSVRFFMFKRGRSTVTLKTKD